MMTSAADLFRYSRWLSTGMPRPLSDTRQPPSASNVTSILVASPAIASSTELSTTSYTRWCSPDGPVDPMYMPGRSRTGSRPLSTVMSLAVYATRHAFLVWVGKARRRGRDPAKVLVRTPKSSLLVYQTTPAEPRCQGVFRALFTGDGRGRVRPRRRRSPAACGPRPAPPATWLVERHRPPGSAPGWPAAPNPR